MTALTIAAYLQFFNSESLKLSIIIPALPDEVSIQMKNSQVAAKEVTILSG